MKNVKNVKNTKASIAAKKVESSAWGLWLLIPVFLILMVVPLIVYLKEIPLSDFLYRNWTGQKSNMDFFNFHKSRVFLFLTFISFIFLGIQVYLKGFSILKNTYFLIPLGLYAFAIFMSAIKSLYPEIAYIGFIDRYEGMYVILAYCFITFYAFQNVDSEKKVRYLFYAFSFSAVILCTIGFFQYFNWDFFKTRSGRLLILPGDKENLVDALKFQFGDKVIYSTLYHYNYVGSYVAIFLPITSLMALYLKEWKMKVFYIGLTLLTGFVWVGCNARSGLVAVTVSILVFVLLMVKKLFRNLKIFMISLSIFVLATGVLGYAARDALYKKYTGSKSEIDSVIKSFSQKGDKTTEPPVIQRLETKGNQAMLNIFNKNLNIKLAEGSRFIFDDGKGNLLDVQKAEKENYYVFKNKEYEEFKLVTGKIGEKKAIVIENKNVKLFFSIEEDKFTLINQKGTEVKFEPIPSIGFRGMENFASARGYIWSRSLPIALNAPLFGYGPDTFSVVFPQNDFNGKILAYGDMYMLVDKAHNFYLQTAIGSGIVALLAVLILTFGYFIQSIILYFNCDTKNMLNVYGMACFLAILGFMVSLIFNDSTVSVAPLAWIVLGIGLALNKMVRHRRKAELAASVSSPKLEA